MKTITKIVCLWFLSIMLTILPLVGGITFQGNSASPVKSVTAIIPRHFPPQYSLNEKGKPIGFAIDVMEVVAKEAGLRVKYEIKNDWVQVQAALMSGEGDLIPNIGITSERSEKMAFTEPLEIFSLVIFVREQNHTIHQLEDLKNNRVGGVKENLGLKILKEEHPEIEVEEFDHVEQALWELLAGDVDAVIYPEPVFWQIARDAQMDSKIRVVGEPLLEVKRAMAVRKDNQELLARLQPAVENLIHSPKYQQIYQKWYPPPIPYWSVQRVLWVMGGIFIITLVVIFIWRYLSLRSLRRLQAAEARYRAIVEDQTELICRFQADGVLTFVNEAYCRYFQKTKAELIGTHFYPVISPEDAEQVTRNINNLTVANPIITHEHRVIDPQGKIRWHQWTNRIILDNQGQIIEYQGVGRDITRLKQAEEAIYRLNETLEERVRQRTTELEAEILHRKTIEHQLRQTYERYERLVEKSPALLYEYSSQRGGIYYSSRAAVALGYDLDYLYQNPWLWSDSIHPDDLPQVREVVQQFHAGEEFAIEYRIRDAEGNWHWFYDRSIGRRIEGEEVIIEGLAVDITAYKKSQLALAQAHQQLTFHVNNSLVGVIQWDQQSRIVSWSSQAEKIFGWKEEEVLGKSWRDWQFVYEADEEIFIQLQDNILHQGKSQDFFCIRNYTQDSSLIICEWHTSVLRNEQGQILSILSLVLDVTERQKVQQALKEREELLQTIMDHIPIMIALINNETNQFTWVNREWEKILGWSVADMQGKDMLAEFYPDPDDRQNVINFINVADRNWGDFKTKSRDGRIIDTTWANVRLSDGSLIGIGQDISQRKQMEEAIRESERQLSTLISNLPGIVYRCRNDTNWTVIFISESIQELTGYSAAAFLDSIVTYGQVIHPEDNPKVWQKIQEAIAIKKHFEVTYRIITATNQEKWVFERGRGVFNQKGDLEALEGFIMDITTGKQAEQALQASEEKYRLLFDNNPNSLWVYDLETLAFLEVNQAAIDHYGYSRAEFLSMTIRDILPPKDIPRLESLIAQLKPDINYSGFWQHKKRNGEIIDVEIISHGFEYEGRSARLILAKDITEQLKTQKALQASEERFRRAIINAPFPIMIHAENGEVISINHTWTELTGYTHQEIPTIDDWIEKAYGDRKEVFRSVINFLYELEEKVNEGEFTITTKSGESRIWEFSSAPLGTLSDGRHLVISIGTDISDRKKIEEQMKHDAIHDFLTGLPNRLLLTDRIEQAIKRYQQEDNYLFAILFIDLDRFKVVNDSLGHVVGDELLKAIANTLVNSVRPVDTIARFGGDEFVILLENLKNWQEATAMAKYISERLKTSFTLREQEFFTSASIGITFPSSDKLNPDELLRNADLAMYRAKESGRSCYAIFDAVMHTQATRVLELETSLRWAIERQELVVYYQPIVALDNRRLEGFEALVRWEHPDKGLISPAEFIPLAEETGLIISLGEWVLYESCRQMKTWLEKYPNYQHLRVSVNLSSRQLRQENFLENIDLILQRTGLKGNNLKLELTESMLMHNREAAIYLLTQIRSRNIQISIDDFGTGYSSLSYLHYLPIDTLKIDRSFVARMSEIGENLEIVEAIITLAHHLEMNVVAEGVETLQNLEQLKNLGCEYGQGYLFSKPLNSHYAEQWLQS